MNDARAPDFDAEAYKAGSAEPEWDSRELNLACLRWHHRDLREVVDPIMAGTRPEDARLAALHAATPSCILRQELRDHLVQAGVTLADATALADYVDDREHLEHADKAVALAQAVALQRLEAAVQIAGATRDLEAILKAVADLQMRKATLEGGSLFPLVPSLPKVETEIPPRPWIFGRHLIRGYASLTIAPGGAGKSALATTEALSMATGRRLLHFGPRKPLRVWLWNLEDPLEEIERRVAAVAKRFRISPEEAGDRLFLMSGRDLELKIARTTRGGFEVDQILVAKVIATIREKDFDVLMIDPLVSSHYVSENDNVAMDAVAKTFSGIAGQTGCAIGLSHHVRKGLAGQSRELEVDDARGASAIINAVRSARMLQKMSEDEASKAGVKDRWRYFRAVDGKANLAPPAEASLWYELESVELLNGDEDNDHDNVGVVVPWTYPTLTGSLPPDIIEKVQAVVREGGPGKYRDSPQARDWIGYAIGHLCGKDPYDRAQKQQLDRLVREWVANKVLKVVWRRDANHEKRRFIGLPEDEDEV